MPTAETPKADIDQLKEDLKAIRDDFAALLAYEQGESHEQPAPRTPVAAPAPQILERLQYTFGTDEDPIGRGLFAIHEGSRGDPDARRDVEQLLALVRCQHRRPTHASRLEKRGATPP